MKNHFLKALDLDPQYSQAHYQLALVYQAGGDYELAENHFLKSREINVMKIIEIEKRANKLFKNCQFQNAKILLLRAQEKKYHGSLVNYEISQLYMNQNKLDKAKKYLKQSIELNPLSSKAHRDLSSLLIKQKSYDDAHFHIEKSLDLDYADPHSHLNLGMIMKANKDYVNAELYFLSALDINPTYVTCMLELVDLQLIMGNQEKAKNYYQKARKLSPDLKHETLDQALNI